MPAVVVDAMTVLRRILTHDPTVSPEEEAWAIKEGYATEWTVNDKRHVSLTTSGAVKLDEEERDE